MLERRTPNEDGKDPFVTLVAHEFRNPLSPALGYVRMVLKGTFGALDDKQRQLLHLAQKSLGRLNELTNELSEFSLLEGGGTKFTTETLMVTGLIEEAIASLPADEAKRDVRITFRNHVQAASMQGDRRALQSALGTLLFVVRRELVTARELVVSLRHSSEGPRPVYRVTIGEADAAEALDAADATDLPELNPYGTGGVGFQLLRACHILIDRYGARLLTLHAADPKDPFSKPPPGILLLLPAP